MSGFELKSAPAMPGGEVMAAQAPQGGYYQPDMLDIRRLVQILGRNKRLIMTIVLGAVLAAVVISLILAPRYRAQASIQVDQSSDRVLSSQEVEPVESYLDADRFLQTQVDALKSRAMAERVAKTLHLYDRDGATFYQLMHVAPPKPASDIPRERQIAANVELLLMANLQVELPRQSRIIVVGFKSGDPTQAAQIANTYATQFIEYNLQRKYESTSYARKFLSDQIEAARIKMEAAENAQAAYARSAGLVTQMTPSTTPGGSFASVTGASLAQLNQTANEAIAARVAAEQRWETARKSPVMSIYDVQNNKAIQDMVTERAGKAAMLQQELSIHKAAYPTVVSLTAQVAALDRQIDGLAQGIKRAIHNDYLTASAREQVMLGKVAGLKGNVESEQARMIRYNVLQRDVDTSRTQYGSLLQRYSEVNAQAGISRNNISIIDRATAPLKPASPNLLLNIALALIAGTIVALTFVLVREQLDDAVREPGELESKLGLTLLGVIPQIHTDQDIAGQLMFDPKSTAAEAYNSVRATLLHSSAEGTPKTLLITSSGPGEGKSTSSFAIANAFARAKMRVLVIDCDLRRPSLYSFFGPENSGVGLSTVLSRQAPLDRAIRTRLEPFPLDYMVSGAIPPAPVELLGSQGMKDLLAEVSERYDLVVLDGPPVLGLADAAILSTLAAATVMVVQSNLAHRGTAKSSLRRLEIVGANILGGLLTKFDPKDVGYAYYYLDQYYYHDQYGADEPQAERGILSWLTGMFGQRSADDEAEHGSGSHHNRGG